MTKQLISREAYQKLIPNSFGNGENGVAFDRRFGQIAIARHYLSTSALAKGLVEQRRRREAGEQVPLGRILLGAGLLQLKELVEILEIQEKGSIAERPRKTSLAQIGKYRILRLIGKGGMGKVYEAEDPELKRRVAIKVINDTGGDDARLARFHREAAIAAQLRDSRIVDVYEVASVRDNYDNIQHFIAMEFIEGWTLDEVLQKSSSSRDDCLRMLQEVSQAVGVAHRRGVVHRDLKPSNILVDRDNNIHLTDFGLAQAAQFATKLTQSHEVFGTPQYMAPE